MFLWLWLFQPGWHRDQVWHILHSFTTWYKCVTNVKPVFRFPYSLKPKTAFLSFKFQVDSWVASILPFSHKNVKLHHVFLSGAPYQVSNSPIHLTDDIFCNLISGFDKMKCSSKNNIQEQFLLGAIPFYNPHSTMWILHFKTTGMQRHISSLYCSPYLQPSASQSKIQERSGSVQG